jgi:hypothetical protein
MPSNVVHTCIPCRFSAKQTHTCPHCHEPMTFMGTAFKPPRKTNDSQWRKVAMLVEHDVRFGYCRCHAPRRAKFKTLAQAKNLTESRRSRKKNYAIIEDNRTRHIHRRIAWEGREW